MSWIKIGTYQPIDYGVGFGYSVIQDLALGGTDGLEYEIYRSTKVRGVDSPDESGTFFYNPIDNEISVSISYGDFMLNYDLYINITDHVFSRLNFKGSLLDNLFWIELNLSDLILSSGSYFESIRVDSNPDLVESSKNSIIDSAWDIAIEYDLLNKILVVDSPYGIEQSEKLIALNEFAGWNSGSTERVDISNRIEFEAINFNLFNHFRLIMNISLGGEGAYWINGFGDKVESIFDASGDALNIDDCDNYYTGPIITGAFGGSLDFNGYSISDMVIRSSGGGGGYCGLFRVIYGGDCIIKNARLQGKIFSDQPGIGGSTGPIAGYSDGATIEICECNVETYSLGYVGGVLGRMSSGQASQSCNLSNIRGTVMVGGICGFVQNASIETSYSEGSIHGTSNVGGLIGQNESSSVKYCHSVSPVTGNTFVGGLCGAVISDIGYEDVSNYWDVERSGVYTSEMGMGLTSEQMADTSSFIDWEFYNGIDPYPWFMPVSGYPILTTFVDTLYDYSNPIGLKEYYEIKTGIFNRNTNVWYINVNKQKSLKIYTEREYIEDFSNE